MSETTYQVRIVKHKTSELLMATMPDLPGFIVHAYSIDELAAKLAPEFEAFMNATGRPVTNVQVIRDEAPPDFFPPAFVAKAMLTEVAA